MDKENENLPVFDPASFTEEQIKQICQAKGLLPVPKAQLEKLLTINRDLKAENTTFKNSVVNLLKGVEDFGNKYGLFTIGDNPWKIIGILTKLKKKLNEPDALKQEIKPITKSLEDIARLCNIENNLDFFKKNETERRLTGRTDKGN